MLRRAHRAARPGSTRLSARTLAVRARVTPSREAPFDRLFDALTDDVVHDGPLARERFATRWSDTPALRALAAAKRAPLAPELARELADYHRRLGASAASLANLDRLSRGEAVAAVAGQQPAPLGGPLYALHKTAAAVGLAATATRRLDGPCVPLYWMHGEDSDFAEIRSITVADAALALHDFALPDRAHREGALVGGIPIATLAELHAEALPHWAGLPGQADAAALLERSLGAARDLGEATSALLLALFAEQGLVVVDPRLPAFRAAARVVLDRYLANADALTAAVRSAGDRLEAAIGKRPLADASLESFVFAIEDGGRLKLSAAEARARGAAVTLSPSVALRPAVQDGVFPTVVMACGPGELAYLAQLREVFEGVGVKPAAVAPRFGATWLPPAAVELIERSGAEPWEVVARTDAVIHRVAEARVPKPIAAELERARAAALDGLERFAQASKQVDGSLPQLVESARGKVEFQFERLVEGLSAKLRQQLEREHPEWKRLRYVLLPSDRLQERRLASLEPVARRGLSVVGEVSEIAAEHATRLAAGVHEHVVLEF